MAQDFFFAIDNAKYIRTTFRSCAACSQPGKSQQPEYRALPRRGCDIYLASWEISEKRKMPNWASFVIHSSMLLLHCLQIKGSETSLTSLMVKFICCFTDPNTSFPPSFSLKLCRLCSTQNEFRAFTNPAPFPRLSAKIGKTRPCLQASGVRKPCL